MSTPLAAILLCAGKGTRMKSERAKVLHPLLGLPLCGYPLRRALALGASPVVPVVGHQAQAVETELDRPLPPGLAALRPPGRAAGHGPRGPGRQGGPRRASRDGSSSSTATRPLLREASLRELLASHEAVGGPLALMTFVADQPQGYGRVVREGDRVARIVEQKDCTPEQARTHRVQRRRVQRGRGLPAGRRWPGWSPTTRRASTT